ncbi:cation:proton antiporter [Leucobacter komagatae]|uniref:Solute:hydrogen antiporter n=1 Tax=Leucobacter komagatae TaxID=55969 RepID=A0A0D0IT61_9MICO|nr:sodium:proton antiporter [Leucobacter komagatae]KIP52668.1 solute:hydrogen antiporter [Leucobacter komagatae]
MELLIIGVLGMLGIAGASLIAPKLRIPAPLLLVFVGIVISFLPFVADFEVDPEWILAGILPPLLYSASVSMPTVDFRREFTTISGLSVALVVVSAVVLGLLFSWLIPGLGLAGGIALGAILSPTDAVATTIVKRVGVSPRIVTVLEGESLLNDATALVLLRSAIAASAASVSLWTVLGDFAWAVFIAALIGLVIGVLNLFIRARVKDATVNTVISFTVPFLASLPAEALGGSGLVAAVVAGLITGMGSVKYLTPQHRISDEQNWRTVELLLESTVFLVMGLELSKIINDVQRDGAGVWTAVGLAAIGLVVVTLLRALYVAPLIASLGRSQKRGEQIKPTLERLQTKLDSAGDEDFEMVRDGRSRTVPARRLSQLQGHVRRKSADIDYFTKKPLGWREGTVIAWAGMRGVVTLAAAQTLPAETPSRSLLILVAFLVAGASLLLQGGTLPWVVRKVQPDSPDPQEDAAERAELLELLIEVGKDRVGPAHVSDTTVTPGRLEQREESEVLGALGAGEHDAQERARRSALRREILLAQRELLLAMRKEARFSSATLSHALATLDAEQIALEMREDAADS